MGTHYEKVFCKLGHKALTMYARNFTLKTHLRVLNYWYCEICNVVFKVDPPEHKGVMAN